MTEIAETLKERGSRYGEFTTHAQVSQSIQDVMIRGYNKAHIHQDSTWLDIAADQREALFMIAHKIGRIVNGDPEYADSWVDIAGYAKLVGDRLEERTKND
jgi:hypothetical protein